MIRSQPFDIGDPLPDAKLEDPQGRIHVLANTVKGKAVVVLVYPSNRFPACQQMLRSFLEVFPRLDELAHVFAVTNDSPQANASAASSQSVRFPLLSDRDRIFAGACALRHNLEEPQDFMGAGAFSAIVADPDLRVIKIRRNLSDGEEASDITRFLSEALAIEPQTLPRGAPVLRVPRALDPAFCRRLIEAFETGETVTTGTLRDAAGGGFGEHKDFSVKRRRDHFVRDPELKDELRGLIGRRVIPAIYKAFDYKATRFDDFKIGCYDAESGGYFRPHRDNNTISGAHRRFAMSLNLNTGDYEGGDLRFPEFGPHLHHPDRGEALIFSCSLLHEATPVTAGRRFVLLSFLFGEAEQEMLALRTVSQR